MAMTNPRIRRLLALLLALVLFLTLISHFRTRSRWVPQDEVLIAPGPIPERGIVIPKMRRDNIDWALDMVPDWHAYVYSSSSSPESEYLELPAARGREAMTYLTFIIDHYDRLPKYTAFVHAARDQWHNDILGASTADILRNLRLDTVSKQGFVNFRCSHEPGCPISVNPLNPTEVDIQNKDVRAYFPDIYMELFNVPASKVPHRIGNVCCGQFAVSRERIQERSRNDYIRMRRWALETNMTDSFGIGWVYEKVWHIMFGMDATHCPPFEQCRCDLFGWCGPLPRKYELLVKGAHPWLGAKLGRILGNDNAAGDW